jgi:hypothetical protein
MKDLSIDAHPQICRPDSDIGEPKSQLDVMVGYSGRYHQFHGFCAFVNRIYREPINQLW